MQGINYQFLWAAARKNATRRRLCCKIIKSNACSRCRRHTVQAINFYSQRSIARANKTSSGAEHEWTAKSRTQRAVSFHLALRKIYKTTPSIDAGECAVGDEIKKRATLTNVCSAVQVMWFAHFKASFRVSEILNALCCCWRGCDRWLSLQSFARVSTEQWSSKLEAKTNKILRKYNFYLRKENFANH